MIERRYPKAQHAREGRQGGCRLLAALTILVHTPPALGAYSVLCYGDSLTAGLTEASGYHPYAPFLQRALRSSGRFVVVHGKGLSGRTAAALVAEAEVPGQGLNNLLHRERPLGAALAPHPWHTDLVIILAGTNDLGSPPPTGPSASAKPRDEQIFGSVWALHKLAHAKSIPTVAVSIPESAYQHAHPEVAALRSRVNGLLQAQCEAVPGGLCYFFACPLAWSSSGRADLWERDGLHFSPKGYAVLGTSLATIADRALEEHPNLDEEASASSTWTLPPPNYPHPLRWGVLPREDFTGAHEDWAHFKRDLDAAQARGANVQTYVPLYLRENGE